MNEQQLNIEDQTSEEFNYSPSLWNYKKLALFLGISEGKARQDVMDKKIPYIKIGRSVRFDPVKIKQWLLGLTRSPEER